jgi:hypothetical protein
VKTTGLVAFLVIPLLFSCYPKKPEAPMVAVPAAPLLQALEQQRHAFSGLKAVASATLVKSGHRRTFDTVGVVVDDHSRFRIEAYGPLGQSIMAVVWDGREMLIRLPEENKVDHTGAAGLEKLLGQGLEPSELCAILSGNMPDKPEDTSPVLLCGETGDCILKLSNGSLIRTVRVSYPVGKAGWEPRIRSYELLRSGSLLYRVQFDRVEEISHYPLPTEIVIDSPEKKLQLILNYHEADVNTPIDNEAFSLTDDAETESRQ